jgi:hypothetical protein
LKRRVLAESRRFVIHGTIPETKRQPGTDFVPMHYVCLITDGDLISALILQEKEAVHGTLLLHNWNLFGHHACLCQGECEHGK